MYEILGKMTPGLGERGRGGEGGRGVWFFWKKVQKVKVLAFARRLVYLSQGNRSNTLCSVQLPIMSSQQ